MCCHLNSVRFTVWNKFYEKIWAHKRQFHGILSQKQLLHEMTIQLEERIQTLFLSLCARIRSVWIRSKIQRKFAIIFLSIVGCYLVDREEIASEQNTNSLQCPNFFFISNMVLNERNLFYSKIFSLMSDDAERRFNIQSNII